MYNLLLNNIKNVYSEDMVSVYHLLLGKKNQNIHILEFRGQRKGTNYHWYRELLESFEREVK